MIDAHYRWVIVAAGGLLGCIAIGAMFSLPVFLVPISPRYRMVGDRHIECHDGGLHRNGPGKYGLG